MLRKKGNPRAHWPCGQIAKLAASLVSSSHTAARTLHNTTYSHCVVKSVSMVGGNPPQEVFHEEPHTMLRNVCEKDGSSSFCFSHHMPEKVRALQHDVFGEDDAHQNLKHLVRMFTDNFHCGVSSSSNSPSLHTSAMPLKTLHRTVVDPLVNHYRSVFFNNG